LKVRQNEKPRGLKDGLGISNGLTLGPLDRPDSKLLFKTEKEKGILRR